MFGFMSQIASKATRGFVSPLDQSLEKWLKQQRNVVRRVSVNFTSNNIYISYVVVIKSTMIGPH